MSRFPAPAHPLLTAALLIALASPAWAQSHAHGTAPAPAATKEAPVDPKIEHGSVDHSQMDHSKMDHGSMDHSQMDHSKMDHAAHKTAAPSEPREPIPAITAADRLAAFPPIEHGAMEHAPEIHSMLLVNRLEQWDG
ncbi:copper resistance protein CopB, partial [Stenotrophomonas sp. HMWF003]